MATIQAVFTPDWDGSQATGLVGTIATTAHTAALAIGKYRVFKVVIINQTTPGTIVGPFALRFQLGNSAAGHVAGTPTSTDPFLVSNQENIFETNGAFDSISFANLAADNGAVTLGYAVIPLAKF